MISFELYIHLNVENLVITLNIDNLFSFLFVYLENLLFLLIANNLYRKNDNINW